MYSYINMYVYQYMYIYIYIYIYIPTRGNAARRRRTTRLSEAGMIRLETLIEC